MCVKNQAGGADTNLASAVPAERQWRVSCSTGDGIAPFLDALGKRVKELYGEIILAQILRIILTEAHILRLILIMVINANSELIS